MNTTVTEQIATARLVLRPLRDTDADAITSLAGDIEVARWTALIPHPYPEGDAARFIAHSRTEAGERIFAIALKDRPDALVGMIGLTQQACSSDRVEIGYWLGKPYWGNGLASEAVAALAHEAAGWYPGAVLFAKVFPGNAASMRLLEKAGFTRRGTATCDAPARATRRIDNAALYELAPGDRQRAMS